jgi:hypothetical protein
MQASLVMCIEIGKKHTPGSVKLLLPPRQSRGISPRIRTPSRFLGAVGLFENIQNAMRAGLGEVKLVETEVVLDPGFHRLATFRRRIKAQPELPILIVGPADDAGNVELRGSGNGK